MWVGVCLFGYGHIDTPKGNLDASDGYLSGPDATVILHSQLYPHGTTEQYPATVDLDGNVLTNTAHEYVECSGKGYCDRVTGICDCFAGYSGSSCNLMDCPDVNGEVCAGHGVCVNAAETAQLDAGNIYELWDRDMTQGCKCDPGYDGPRCDQRVCKYGVDPLYFDEDNSELRYANWSYVLYTKDASATIEGNYSIVFYDRNGEDWHTRAIAHDAGCRDISHALEELPNSVIPHNSIRCLQWLDYHSISTRDEPIVSSPSPYYGIKTTLTFPENPGILKQLDINFYLDGKRPTLYSNRSGYPVDVFIYPDGYSGEDIEYFTEKCVGVDVTILEHSEGGGGVGPAATPGTAYHYLSSLTPVEARLLSQCLGDADGIDDTPLSESSSGRVQGQNYTWDFGTIYNPHLVRLVDMTTSPDLVTDLCPGSMNSVRGGGVACSVYESSVRKAHKSLPRSPGFIVPLYYDPSDGRFKLMTRAGQDFSSITTFTVFTTRGTAQMVSDAVQVFTNPLRPYARTLYTTLALSNLSDPSPPLLNFTAYDGNLDCETNLANTNGAWDCLEKGDRVFFLDPHQNTRSMATNPKYLNLYTVQRVYRRSLSRSGFRADGEGFRAEVLPVGAESEQSSYSVEEADYYSNATARNRIVLDMSINSAWQRSTPFTSIIERDSARVYSFRPPLNADAAAVAGGGGGGGGGGFGFRYVSECANRGGCDRETGLCNCYSGFEGDACQIQTNAVS